jgi:hypothetical protein
MREGSPALATLWWAQPFRVGSTEHVAMFVTEQQEGATCHACGVWLDAAVYRSAAAGWQFESKTLSIGEIGAFGDPPDLEGIPVLELAPETAGFLLQASDIGTGVEEVNVRVLAYRSEGAQWIDAGLVPLGANNSPSCSDDNAKGSTKCWGYMGQLSLAAGSTGGLRDLKVVRQGTNEAGKPVADVTFAYDPASRAYVER